MRACPTHARPVTIHPVPRAIAQTRACARCRLRYPIERAAEDSRGRSPRARSRTTCTINRGIIMLEWDSQPRRCRWTANDSLNRAPSSCAHAHTATVALDGVGLHCSSRRRVTSPSKPLMTISSHLRHDRSAAMRTRDQLRTDYADPTNEALLHTHSCPSPATADWPFVRRPTGGPCQLSVPRRCPRYNAGSAEHGMR